MAFIGSQERHLGRGGGRGGVGWVWVALKQFHRCVSKPCAKRDHRKRGQESWGPVSGALSPGWKVSLDGIDTLPGFLRSQPGLSTGQMARNLLCG